jgi:hypothetical protein
MECYTSNQYYDCSCTCATLGHEPKICQHEAELEPEYTGDITVGSQPSAWKDGTSIVTHNGAPIYCI